MRRVKPGSVPRECRLVRAQGSMGGARRDALRALGLEDGATLQEARHASPRIQSVCEDSSINQLR